MNQVSVSALLAQPGPALYRNSQILTPLKKKVTLNNYYYLSENSSLDEAAKNLYSFLRKIKNMGYN